LSFVKSKGICDSISFSISSAHRFKTRRRRVFPIATSKSGTEARRGVFNLMPNAKELV